MKQTVSVLLSTYNGEQYIKQLVDSVLNQEDVEVKLQIRDDGSTDKTIEILEGYKDPRITIYKGKNLKPAKSFLALLKMCEQADYYAYCDQDDYWYPRKLITAIERLRGCAEPALFISTYDVADENLNKLFTFDMKFEESLRLQDIIIYRVPSGCNMVFNNGLRDVINKSNPDSIRMHDFWTLLVAISHKYTIITLQVPLIMYRQHAGESVGITPTVVTRVKRLWRSLTKGNNERWAQAKSLYDAYKDEIESEELDILEKVVGYRNSMRSRIALFTDKRFKTSSIYINVLFRTSVLIGKF